MDDADDAQTPRESPLSGTLGQLREYVRTGFAVEVSLVWRLPDGRLYRASNGSIDAERALLSAALGVVTHHTELAEVSEISEADP